MQRAGKNGRCWPGNRNLSETLNCSVSQIIRSKQQLVSLGLIEQIRVGKRRTNRYRFLDSPLVKPEDYKRTSKPKVANMPPTLNDILGNTPVTSYDVLPDMQHEVADTPIGDVADTTTPIVNESNINESINESTATLHVADEVRDLYEYLKKAHQNKFGQPYPENNKRKDLAQLQALSKRFSHESSWGELSAGGYEHICKIINTYFDIVPEAADLGITGLLIRANRVQAYLERHVKVTADRSLRDAPSKC